MPSQAATSVFRRGATALITGSGSGVGLATARLCASHGMNLILIDTNSAALSAAKTSISSASQDITVETHDTDVSSLESWTQLKAAVEKNGRKLDLLHLNAGIGRNGSWTENEYWRAIFDVNFFGVVNGLNTFYDHFDGSRQVTGDEGQQKAIIVTGSKQGITNPPGNPAYNASKSAVKTLAEHLHFDLKKANPLTSVHLLVPGWTFTGMTSGGKAEKPAGAWAPEQVADFLYQKMGEGKFYAICPDNDVEWETDRKRMTWTMGDIVYEREPQSRWIEEYKKEAEETMGGMKLGEKQNGSSA